MSKKIYLAGGYFTYANYGDVIQARAWVDFYSRRGFHVALLHAAAPEQAAEFRHYLGEHVELIHHHSVLKDKTAASDQDVFHLYGGGYLNSVWGGQFSNLLRAFGRRGAKIISTGCQLDSTWARYYRHELRGTADVQWLSVRDKYSRNYLGIDRLLLCDDSFLYFLDADRKQPSLGPSARPGKIIVHFNLSDYVIKHFSNHPQAVTEKVINALQFKKTPSKALYENIVRNYLDQGYAVTVLRNFPTLPDDVVEAERLFTDRRLLSRLTLQDTFAAERQGASPQFGITNSFHVAIMMNSCLSAPVFFLALNNYYKQKSEALIEYGVVDQAAVITSVNRLTRLQTPAGSKHDPDVAREMSERAKLLKRAVLEAVNA
jgi:hypothetical protein